MHWMRSTATYDIAFANDEMNALGRMLWISKGRGAESYGVVQPYSYFIAHLYRTLYGGCWLCTPRYIIHKIHDDILSIFVHVPFRNICIFETKIHNEFKTTSSIGEFWINNVYTNVLAPAYLKWKKRETSFRPIAMAMRYSGSRTMLCLFRLNWMWQFHYNTKIPFSKFINNPKIQ